VNPDLVIRDTEGRPETVRYEQLNAMLLNEFLTELKTVQELKSAIQKQEVIFRREITGWPSPDARYAIRKKFSDEYTDPNSKVVKAELIEKKSGKVIVDLTREHIGVGRQKEGEVMWSPDSKHFGYSSFGEDEVRLSIFRSLGEKFVKVDLPSVDEKIPKPENDPELKDTKLDCEMSESESMR
jgi:hypothetical protein